MQVYLQRLPGFAGRRYGDLQAYLPYATVYDTLLMAVTRCLGVNGWNRATGVCLLASSGAHSGPSAEV